MGTKPLRPETAPQPLGSALAPWWGAAVFAAGVITWWGLATVIGLSHWAHQFAR